MQVKKLVPNHICCNPNCHKGEYGQPKHYYACDYCNRSQNWRSRYCCVECYLEDKEEKVKKPQRTDMTEEEVDKLMAAPIEEIKKKTLEDLADYKDYIEENGLAKTIDFINEQIDLGDCWE